MLHFAIAADKLGTLWFVVAPELAPLLADAVPAAKRASIRVLALQPFERALCCHRALAVSGFARWLVMRRYLRLTGAGAGHFLSVDHLSLPLALGLGGGGSRLSGILFRPSVHYRSLSCYRPGFGERLRDLRKILLYRLMLLNGALKVVLSLDPYFAPYAAARYRGGGKIWALPDPAYPAAQTSESDAALATPFPPDRQCYLLFGAITERKGVLVLLDALALLPTAAAAKIAVMLAGRIDPSIRNEIDERCRQLAARRPGLWLRIEDRRLASAEIAALVRRSDVVLAPYQRFVGSSGVLLWAAAAGKPLLTQDFGLIGRLVRDHRLGLATDVCEPSGLALAIGRMAVAGTHGLVDGKSAADFVSERTPERFAALVFASLASE